MTLALFNWSRAAGGAQLATWGRYSALLAHHRSGGWTVDLYHGSRRTRHEELSPDITATKARMTAEQWLLDEQGPEVRELVRRTRLAEGRGAGTVRLRAVGGGKRRKVMGTKKAKGHVAKRGGGYWTVIIPPAPYAQATEWHDTSGRAATLSRGAFATKSEATKWAKEKLRGASYSLRKFGGGGKRRHAHATPSKLGALVADINKLTR